MIWAFGDRSGPPNAHTAAYFAEVASEVESIPYKIGRWVGTDVEVQPSAVRLLKPNKLLQRRYVNPETGASVQLLIVHCGDTRDMLGHFPPVCYPAHGWVQQRTTPTEIRVIGTPSPATEYRFKRTLGEAETDMVVSNFFVLPGSIQRTAPDIGALNAASQSLAMSTLGAAQVQIVTPPGLSEKERAEIVDEFVAALEPVIHAITQDRSVAE